MASNPIRLMDCDRDAGARQFAASNAARGMARARVQAQQEGSSGRGELCQPSVAMTSGNVVVLSAPDQCSNNNNAVPRLD